MIAITLIASLLTQDAVPGVRSLTISRENAASHFKIRVAAGGLATLRFSEPLKGSPLVDPTSAFVARASSAEQLNIDSKAKRAGDRATLTVVTRDDVRLAFDLVAIEPSADADAFVDIQLNLR